MYHSYRMGNLPLMTDDHNVFMKENITLTLTLTLT